MFLRRALWSGSGTWFDSGWVAFGVAVFTVYLLWELSFSIISGCRNRKSKDPIRKEVTTMNPTLFVEGLIKSVHDIGCGFVGGFLLQAREHVLVRRLTTMAQFVAEDQGGGVFSDVVGASFLRRID